jgi:hypothetical protein
MSVPTQNGDIPAPRTSEAVYEPAWLRLSDAADCITQTGVPKNIAQEALCQAISDGAIKFRAQLKRNDSKAKKSKSVLQGGSFETPAVIKPTDFDWEKSNPFKPWIVPRGAYNVPGSWELAWIEVRKADVTDVLCGQQVRKETSQHNAEPAKIRSGRTDGSSDPLPPEDEHSAAPAPRPRGPRPAKLIATKDAMLDDIRSGKVKLSDLRHMVEKVLANRYSVSRDTARKALNAVLSEFEG